MYMWPCVGNHFASNNLANTMTWIKFRLRIRESWIELMAGMGWAMGPRIDRVVVGIEDRPSS